MLVINARNVNEALPIGLMYLEQEGRPIAPRDRRATLEYPGPVTTIYRNPSEKVLFQPERDANPFFHFFEALWILAGRRDVEFLTRFNARMSEFSDDGVTFHAPYGHRLRKHFNFDQIESAIVQLRRNPESRRIVLQIWDCAIDLGRDSRDIPCNDLIMLKARGDVLNMTVLCRSNDVLWGAYGANVVQFSTLLEYIAAKAGFGVGRYEQVSDSFHVYTDIAFWQSYRSHKYAPIDPYADGDVEPYNLFGEHEEFDADLADFFHAYDYRRDPERGLYRSRAFREVVRPMYEAHGLYKRGDLNGAESLLWRECVAQDWKLAAQKWLQRRIKAREAKAIA